MIRENIVKRDGKTCRRFYIMGGRNTPRCVGKRHNKQWMLWLAIDRATRELKKKFHIGGRSREAARKFWQSLHYLCIGNVQLLMGGAPPLVINRMPTKELYQASGIESLRKIREKLRSLIIPCDKGFQYLGRKTLF